MGSFLNYTDIILRKIYQPSVLSASQILQFFIFFCKDLSSCKTSTTWNMTQYSVFRTNYSKFGLRNHTDIQSELLFCYFKLIYGFPSVFRMIYHNISLISCLFLKWLSGKRIKEKNFKLYGHYLCDGFSCLKATEPLKKKLRFTTKKKENRPLISRPFNSMTFCYPLLKARSLRVSYLKRFILLIFLIKPAKILLCQYNR